MKEYQIFLDGGDEILTGPIVELTDDEVKVVEKLFGGSHQLKGDWNGVTLVDITKSKEIAKKKMAQQAAEMAEEEKRRAAEKAKRDSYIALNTYGTTNAMMHAFQKAMKEKAGE